MQKLQKRGSDIVKQIGDYTINSKDILGKGSFGVVYKCTDKSKITWAAKQISKAFIREKKDYLENLLRQEVTLQKKMKSQNIVKLKDFLITDNNYYLILDFCDEGDLKQQIQKEKRFSEQKAKDIMIQIVKGLKEMNERQIVHRDIKPENILIASSTEGNIYKIGDFGFAKSMNNYDIVKSQVGTPLYMDPQILMGKAYDSKCDIWSLGIIFYEMIYGHTPWPKVTSQYDLLEKIKFIPVKFHESISLSEKAKSLIKRMLERDPSKRISYSELLNDSYFRQINQIKIFQHLREQQSSFIQSNENLNFQPKVKDLLPQQNLPFYNQITPKTLDTDNYNQNIVHVYKLLEFSKKDFEMFNRKIFNYNYGNLDLVLFQQFVEGFLGKGDYSQFFNFVLQQSSEFNIKKSPQNQQKILLEDLILLFKQYDKDYEQYVHQYLQKQNTQMTFPLQKRESIPTFINPSSINLSFGTNINNFQTGIYENQIVFNKQRDQNTLVTQQIEKFTNNNENIEQTFQFDFNQEKFTQIPQIKQSYFSQNPELNTIDSYKYLDNAMNQNNQLNQNYQSVQNIQSNLQNKLFSEEVINQTSQSLKFDLEKLKTYKFDDVSNNDLLKQDHMLNYHNIELIKYQSEQILPKHQKLEFDDLYKNNANKNFHFNTQQNLNERIQEHIQQNALQKINDNLKKEPYLHQNSKNDQDSLLNIPYSYNEMKIAYDKQENQSIKPFEYIPDQFDETKRNQTFFQRRYSEQIQSLQFQSLKDSQIAPNSFKQIQFPVQNYHYISKESEFPSYSLNNIQQFKPSFEQNKENIQNTENYNYNQVLNPLPHGYSFGKQNTTSESNCLNWNILSTKDSKDQKYDNKLINIQLSSNNLQPLQIQNENRIYQNETKTEFELNNYYNNYEKNNKYQSYQDYSPNKTQMIKHQQSYNPFDTSPSESLASAEDKDESNDEFFLDFILDKPAQQPQLNKTDQYHNTISNFIQNKQHPSFDSNDIFNKYEENKLNNEQNHISTGISYIFYD